MRFVVCKGSRLSVVKFRLLFLPHYIPTVQRETHNQSCLLCPLFFRDSFSCVIILGPWQFPSGGARWVMGKGKCDEPDGRQTLFVLAITIFTSLSFFSVSYLWIWDLCQTFFLLVAPTTKDPFKLGVEC